MEDKLLVCIVSYQRKSFTQGTIESIYKLKPKNTQIIVCDNGSTDAAIVTGKLYIQVVYPP